MDRRWGQPLTSGNMIPAWLVDDSNPGVEDRMRCMASVAWILLTRGVTIRAALGQPMPAGANVPEIGQLPTQ